MGWKIYFVLCQQALIILCCIRGRGQEALGVMELCHKFKNEGVVAIDIAGDEGSFVDKDNSCRP